MTIITDKHLIIASKILADWVEELLKSNYLDWSCIMHEVDLAHSDWEALYLNLGEEWCIADLYNGDKISDLMEVYYDK